MISIGLLYNCVVPEEIHAHPKIPRGRGVEKPNFLNKSMTLKWNFQRGGGVQFKTPSVGGVRIFSGTNLNFLVFKGLLYIYTLFIM